MKKDFLIKLIPAGLVGAIFLYALSQFSGPCPWESDQTRCLYEYKYAIIDPLYYGAKWLLVILVVMMIVPFKIYRNWALTVLPITLVISYLIISNISVYSSGVLSISRSQMAVNCMVVLAGLSALFVAFHYVYNRYASKK
jgi:hypothetical protein